MINLDWNRRACSRRGHVTFAPDEPEFRARLHARTAHGDAWRCLRCGDFTLGRPHATGPAEHAPLVPRGKALRDLLILRLLAVERLLRGVLVVLAAWAVWKFSNSRDAVHRLFAENLPVFKPVEDHFNLDLEHSPIADTIRKTFEYKHSTLLIVATALVVYAAVELIEAVGLWLGRRWAEYLTVVATAAFLPLEGYELHDNVSALKVATLILNILAVVWILATKRLFGLRGGREAFEAERHSASLLEIEAAAAAA